MLPSPPKRGRGGKNAHAALSWCGCKQLAAVEALADQNVGVALSGDGKVLATWGRSGVGADPEQQKRNQTVQLWDTTTGKERIRLRGEPSSAVVAGAALSSDGGLIAIANGQATMTVWDASGKELRRFAWLRGVGSYLAFAPDARTLAAATPDGRG